MYNGFTALYPVYPLDPVGSVNPVDPYLKIHWIQWVHSIFRYGPTGCPVDPLDGSSDMDSLDVRESNRFDVSSGSNRFNGSINIQWIHSGRFSGSTGCPLDQMDPLDIQCIHSDGSNHQWIYWISSGSIQMDLSSCPDGSVKWNIHLSGCCFLLLIHHCIHHGCNVLEHEHCFKH